MSYTHKVAPGEKIDLRMIDPGATPGLSRKKADAALDDLNEQLTALQEDLYAAAHHAVLVVLQGLDTAGKDGTIKHVMAQFNPAGCRVETFKVPTPDELAHDFLWRVHRVTPAKGMLSIFNRSHYEDVLVTRVHGLVSREVCRRRYDHINAFERLLSDNGTLILKFFLYISKDEQGERLREREEEKDKAWKLSTSDWSEHALYDDYITAYEDALAACSTEWAPWYIVPADHKWFRNVAVAQTLIDVLHPYQQEWRRDLEERGKEQLEAIKKTGKS